MDFLLDSYWHAQRRTSFRRELPFDRSEGDNMALEVLSVPCEVFASLPGLGSKQPFFWAGRGCFCKAADRCCKTDEAAKAVLGTIKSFKEVWQATPERERKKLAEKAQALALRQTGHVVSCPACSCDALLSGNPIAAPKKSLRVDLVVVNQSKAPSHFHCISCGLKINGLSHLIAAGLEEIHSKPQQHSMLQSISILRTMEDTRTITMSQSGHDCGPRKPSLSTPAALSKLARSLAGHNGRTSVCLDQPQNHVAVPFARPAHSPEMGEDSRIIS